MSATGTGSRSIDSAVLYESLHSYPERRRRTLFEREGNEISFPPRPQQGRGDSRSCLTPTTLALSAAMRLGDLRHRQPPAAPSSWLNALGLKQAGSGGCSFPS